MSTSGCCSKSSTWNFSAHASFPHRAYHSLVNDVYTECQCHSYGFSFKLPSTFFQAVTAWEAFNSAQIDEAAATIYSGSFGGHNQIMLHLKATTNYQTEGTNPLYPIQSALITCIHRQLNIKDKYCWMATLPDFRKDTDTPTERREWSQIKGKPRTYHIITILFLPNIFYYKGTFYASYS